MNKKYIFLLILIFLAIFIFLSNSKVYEIVSFNNILRSSDINILLLGKPGEGYIGSDNTDTLIVLHLDLERKKAYLIPIPRDLVVYNNEGNLEKINALYEKRKIKTLLEKVSEYIGFDIKNYFVFDLALVKNLVDFIGGVEMEIKEPITDAVTLYTLPPGKYVLNSYLIELVLRSRYNPKGDFFRINNQIEFIKALKEKIKNIPLEERINLIKFLENNKKHYETNISKEEIFKIALKLKDIDDIEIVPIIVDIDSGLLKSIQFTLYNTPNVYGIAPKLGIDNYSAISIYIQSKIEK